MITETRSSQKRPEPEAEPEAEIQLFWRPQEIGKDFELGPYIPVGDLIESNPNIRRIDVRDMICSIQRREHLAPVRKYLGPIIINEKAIKPNRKKGTPWFPNGIPTHVSPKV